MSEKNNTNNARQYDMLSIYENLEMISYSLICFLVPFLLAYPQWLIGTIVNTTLVLAAFNLKNNYKLLPIIVLPSIGVFSRGIIFGPYTPYLIYMLPIIWLGNFLLIYIVKTKLVPKITQKNSKFQNINNFLNVLLGSIVKAGLLFAFGLMLFKSNLIPVIFLTSMGLFQFYTALAGGVIAIYLNKIRKLLHYKRISLE